MAFTLYQSSDASAPVLDGLATSFIDVIRACLVDGYGSKTAAGWSIVMDDGAATKLVITNASGFGSKWSINDDGSTPGAAHARIRMWEAVTDYDTGTNGAAPVYVRKSSTTASTARPWFVIADDRFCYFFNAPMNTSGWDNQYSYVHWFGDGVPLNVSDVYFALAGGALYSGYYSALPAISSLQGNASAGNAYTVRSQRPMSGSGASAAACLRHGSLNSGYINLETFPFMGKKILWRPIMDDYGPYTMRGFLPGFYWSGHSSTLFNHLTDYTFNGTTYKAVKVNNMTFFLNMANPR